jgi:hypothetical protein
MPQAKISAKSKTWSSMRIAAAFYTESFRLDDSSVWATGLPEWRDRIETYFAYNPAEEPQMPQGIEFIASGTTAIAVEQAREEEGIAHRVEFELYAAKAFDMGAIQVTARDGNITLAGRVGSRAEFILAHNIALTVDGVQNVNNNLKVSKVA